MKGRIKAVRIERPMLRGSAVTDGDAFVKIEGIVEGY
jgi:hypothetical protein